MNWPIFKNFITAEYNEIRAELWTMILGGVSAREVFLYLKSKYDKNPYLGSMFNGMLTEFETELIFEDTPVEDCKYFIFLLGKFPVSSGRNSSTAFCPTPTAFGPMPSPTPLDFVSMASSATQLEGEDAEASFAAATGGPVPTPTAFGPTSLDFVRMALPTQHEEVEELVNGTFGPIWFDGDLEEEIPSMCSCM